MVRGRVLALALAITRMMMRNPHNPIKVPPTTLRRWLARAKDLEYREAHLIEVYKDLGLEFGGSEPFTRIRELKEAHVLWKKLEPVFLKHVGERGADDGAVGVLNRIIRERDSAESLIKRIYAASKCSADHSRDFLVAHVQHMTDEATH